MNKELTPLEALEKILNNDFDMMITTYPPIPADMNSGMTKKEMIELVKNALKESEQRHKMSKWADEKLKEKLKKQAEILRIIKEKKVYIPLLKFELETYNSLRDEKEQLTPTEFDLLKEILNDN